MLEFCFVSCQAVVGSFDNYHIIRVDTFGAMRSVEDFIFYEIVVSDCIAQLRAAAASVTEVLAAERRMLDLWCFMSGCFKQLAVYSWTF